jgi:hypothetical protein
VYDISNRPFDTVGHSNGHTSLRRRHFLPIGNQRISEKLLRRPEASDCTMRIVWAPFRVDFDCYDDREADIGADVGSVVG